MTKFYVNQLLTFTVCAVSISNVHAQPDKSLIEVIEVTAQKRTQSINEIPMSISAFNANQLEELGIEDSTDLANIVPGLNYSDTAFGPPVYTLRGVGFNESSAQATSTVGVYVDEVAIPFPIMTKAANLDLERVEILKGPQGTLFGRNTTAGAVHYIAAKPSQDFESGITATVGRFNTFSGEGYITGALTDDLNGRAAMKLVKANEGWQESVSRDDQLGKKDKLTARLSFDWGISDKTNALLSLSYNNDESETLAPQAIEYIAAKAGGAINSSFDIFGPILDSETNPQLFPGNNDKINAADWTADRTPALAHEMQSLSLNINHQFSDSLTFVSLTGIHQFEDNGSQYERGGTAGVTAGYIRNLTGGSLDTVFGGSLKDFYEGHLHGDYASVPDSEYVPSDYVFQYGTIDSFSQEFRLTNTLPNSVWIAGLYYSKNDVDYRTTQDWGLATNVNIAPTEGFGFNKLTNAIEQETTTKAIFANVDWQYSDKLSYVVGLRYSDDEAKYKGCTEDIDGAGLALFNQFFFGGEDSGGEVNGCVTVIDFGGPEQRVGQIQETLSEDSLSWRFAANYQWSDATSLYASYSRGFKAGSFPSLAAIVENQLDPVVQEQLDAYEIGMKAMLADNSAQLNLSAFYYDYKDKQLLTKKIIPVFRTAFTLGNIDESYVQGAEMSLQWYPTDRLYVGLSASYIDSEVTSGNGFNQLGEALDLTGSPLPFTSDFQTNLIVQYEWEVGSKFTGFVSFDGAYSSEFSADFQAQVSTTNQVSDFIGSPVEVIIPPQPYQYDERFTQPDYFIANARIGIESKQDDWRAYLWVRNLTDEYYISSVVKNNEMVAAYPGMTKTYGITFEKTFF
ncbi:TonB-dependent receptor [Thalassotalea loyana]|uniref:TonB-dependent receptor n=1 Tax=Thalassotalea loyana TaxID=280483 RepID=A0ABQ6HCZ0_9GAMM|nr:TonB-dependent receptor [Thalassotalea loyana]GLX84351.1 TonB-dependent receptor [Thalassotalea loyana]